MKSVAIDLNSRKKITEQLSQFLADTYVLYVKTQNFHWNVIDPRFASLHKFFEEQYEDLAEAVDLIAERIRGLQILAPGSMKEFLKLTTLKESGNNLSADEMLKQLTHDHEQIADQIRPMIPFFQKFADEGSADLLIERLRIHEKTVWMLRSHFPK